MKITEINAIPLDIPVMEDQPGIFRPCHLLVEVKTSDGLVGWGQSFVVGSRAAVTAVIENNLRPLVLGEDSRAIRALTRKMFQNTHNLGHSGITTFGISGIELALWDLAGKRAGKPLCDLLGGAEGREVQAYASVVRYPEGDPRIAAKAKKAEESGYGMIKLHQCEPQSFQAAREVISADMPLTADINCRWNPREAERKAAALDEYDLYWLEEPVWPPEDFKGLAALQARISVPLASGENAYTPLQFKDMMEAEAVSFVQPSLAKVGGVGEWLKIAALAEAHNVAMAPHSPYFGPAFLATLHLIAVTRQARWVETNFLEYESPIFTQPIPFKNGVFTLPEGPGLGLEVDPNVLKEYRVKA